MIKQKKIITCSVCNKKAATVKMIDSEVSSLLCYDCLKTIANKTKDSNKKACMMEFIE